MKKVVDRRRQQVSGKKPSTNAPVTREPHALLAMQRSSGNRAVAGIVARQPQPQAGPAPAVPLEEAESKRVAPADRHAIEIANATDIALAFTAFSNATAAHTAAIKNEAKAKAELYAAIIDVATGFLAPVFAGWAVGKLTALAAQEPFVQTTKKAVEKLISSQDFFKASFTGATKVANQVMKSNANALFGETEIEAFAHALRDTFQAGAGAVAGRLTTMTDDELLATWTAYHPQVANETAYRQVLGGLFARYQTQVEPIGTSSGPYEGGQGASSEVYEVQLAGRKRLANITVWASGEKVLWAWITPDMDSIARAKATALGLGIPTIALKDVWVALAEILDPPHPELRQKDMLEIAQALPPTERQRAGADPDVVTVVETGREIDGRVPNQYERHKTLFVLRGFSSHALVCLDELDSWFPNGFEINRQLEAADPAERRRLAQDQWFVGRLRANLDGRVLQQVLFTLGLGPAPPPEPPPHPIPHYHFHP